MLIGFNNIHFSWKETILLIEERREREPAERRKERERKKRGAPFHFQVRPWDDALEKALYRFRANEIKWCRPWQKGEPKLKAIYFHWGMWHCSGTINGGSTVTGRVKDKRWKIIKRWKRWADTKKSVAYPQWFVLLPFYLFLSFTNFE